MSNYTTWIEQPEIDESDGDKLEINEKKQNESDQPNEQIAPHVMQHTISSHQKTNEQAKKNTFSRLGGLTRMTDNNAFQRLELYTEEKQLD
jgi:hypothetical protein